MLHCIEQSSEENSGENFFADGLKVSEILKNDYEEYYKILTTIQVLINDIGTDEFGEFDFRLKRPIIG